MDKVLVACAIFPDIVEGLRSHFDVEDNPQDEVPTPHIANASLATQCAMAELAAANLGAAPGCGPRADQPPTPVNPEVLRR